MYAKFERCMSSLKCYSGQTGGHRSGGKEILVLAQTCLVGAWTKSELGKIQSAERFFEWDP